MEQGHKTLGVTMALGPTPVIVDDAGDVDDAPSGAVPIALYGLVESSIAGLAGTLASLDSRISALEV